MVADKITHKCVFKGMVWLELGEKQHLKSWQNKRSQQRKLKRISQKGWRYSAMREPSMESVDSVKIY